MNHLVENKCPHFSKSRSYHLKYTCNINLRIRKSETNDLNCKSKIKYCVKNMCTNIYNQTQVRFG